MTRWTTLKLVVIGGLAAFMTVAMIIGATITAVTGQIALGGLINGFITPIITVLCLFLIENFGSASLLFFVFGILTIPLPLAGPPGWFIKVPIRFIGGVIADLLYILLRRNKIIAALLINAILQIYTGVAVFGLGLCFEIPLLMNTAEFFFSPAGIGTAVFFGCAGGYLGYLIYNKIKNTSIVKRIQK